MAFTEGTGQAQVGGAPASEHAAPMFPAASDEHRQGFVRVINHSDEAGEVTIEAFDDGGRSYPVSTLMLNAEETVHFNSEDLEGGNPNKGLTGGSGAGDGDWRLTFASSLNIEVLAYIRTRRDGFLTSMHDTVPREGTRHHVGIFNPGSNTAQVSSLRLINMGGEEALVTIEGVDDRGTSPGGAVQVSIDAGATQTLTATELELGVGTGMTGALGDGAGKWRLTVTSETPLSVLSLLSSPTGHLTNLSTSPGRLTRETAEEAFQTRVSPIVQGKCVSCHVDGGVAGNTNMVFVTDDDAEHLGQNFGVFEAYLEDVEGGAELILEKIQGVNHDGGIQVASGTEEFSDMERFLEQLEREQSDQSRRANLFSGPRGIAAVTGGAVSVHAADLDGDGDADVLSASRRDDSIAWHQNLGDGKFSEPRAITTDADGAVSVYAADLDGDRDLDVLAASWRNSTVAWHENLGGGAFSEQHTITTEADGAVSVHAADLDGDGDVDVLAASWRDDTVAWHENLGGGAFSERRAITTDADGAQSVYATDLDGDGDADVLASSSGDDTVAWHENLGGDVFSERRAITTRADGVQSAYPADLNGDGNLDILSASFDDDTVAWHENLGGGRFSARRVVSNDVEGAESVHAADLDGDGDFDVLSGSFGSAPVVWHENLGAGTFSEGGIISREPDRAASVHVADLDGDGQFDVLSTSHHDDAIVWYGNLGKPVALTEARQDQASANAP